MARYSPLQPCAPKSLRVPNWKADQRQQPRGSRETVLQHRYVVRTDGAPCVRSDGMRRSGQRTRCFKEGDHSHRRKTCRLLVAGEDFDHDFPQGMHLSGVGALRSRGFACNLKDLYDIRNGKPVSKTIHMGDATDAYAVTVLGPCLHVRSGVLQILCAGTAAFVNTAGDPSNIAAHFSKPIKIKVNSKGTVKNQEIRYAPTLPMLRAWHRRLVDVEAPGNPPDDAVGVAAAMQPAIDKLADRFRMLQALQSRCNLDKRLCEQARIVLRNTFQVGMYARRWQGPGTPYPVPWVGKVGTASRPVSDELVGQFAALTPSGAVRFSDVNRASDGLQADHVNGEGRLDFLENKHLGGAYAALDVLSAQQKEFLKTHMLACLETTYCIDGTHWPSDETLFDVLELVCTGLRTDTSSCLRRNSLHMIRSCEMLARFVYKTEPTWMKYEGFLIMYDEFEG